MAIIISASISTSTTIVIHKDLEIQCEKRTTNLEFETAGGVCISQEDISFFPPFILAYRCCNRIEVPFFLLLLPYSYHTKYEFVHLFYAQLVKAFVSSSLRPHMASQQSMLSVKTFFSFFLQFALNLASSQNYILLEVHTRVVLS